MKKPFLTQCIVLFLILSSCLILSIGSWLETNSSTKTSQHLSLFKVTMVNGSEMIYLTFGLWKYCLFNVSSNLNTCSYNKMNFDIGKFILY